MYGPDPNAVFPNENIKSLCFIKNVIARPNIIVGDYACYYDIDGANHRMCGGDLSLIRSVTEV